MTLLKEMETSISRVSPDLLSYSGVISCIAKSERFDDAKKAEDVLNRMTMANDVRPDNGKSGQEFLVFVRHHCRSSTERFANSQTCILFLPLHIIIQVIFNQVMNIYSKGGMVGSSEKCENLLKRMDDLAGKGNQQVSPDVRTYNILLSAYANEKGPADAEKVLQRLESHRCIKPNSISFITCMDAFAKVGDAHNNLRILSLMEKAFESGNVHAKPTRRAYVSALNSLAKSGRGDAGTRAEALVQRMEKFALSGNADLLPDTTVYNVLINCHKNSASQAEKVLYRMGKRSIERDVVSYSSVINVYSKMGGIQAARRAQALLDEMQDDSIEPNAHTFSR